MTTDRKDNCDCCGCLTIQKHTPWPICPVCFWEDHSPDPEEGSPRNLMLTIKQARENYRQFGAFDKSALPYVREPLPEEISDKTLETKGYPAGREKLNWFWELPKEMPMADFFIVASAFKLSLSVSCYVIKDGCFEIDRRWRVTPPGVERPDSIFTPEEYGSVFDRYEKHFALLRKFPGYHFLEYKDRKLVRHRNFNEAQYINSNIYSGHSKLVIFYKEYGYMPADESDRRNLEGSLEDERRLCNTLYTACELNDTEQILKLLSELTPAKAEEMKPHVRYMLNLLAVHDNLKAYKAICETELFGLSKVKKMSGLDNALEHSLDIVFYIHDVSGLWFTALVAIGLRSGAAAKCRDREKLEHMRRIGWKISDSGYNDPPLHQFIQQNNTVGVQFLYDHGVKLDKELNIYGLTAAEAAEKDGFKNEAYELMLKLMKRQ